MKFLEKDLEDIIWEAQKTDEGRDKLHKRGLSIKGKIFRQFNLGEYGICDLVSYYKEGRYFYVDLYELKKDRIDIKALMQAAKYKNAIKRYLDEKLHDKYDAEVFVNLIGSEIDYNSDMIYLTKDLCDYYIYTYSYDIDGIHFEQDENTWDLINRTCFNTLQLPELSLNDLRTIIR